MLYKAEGHIDSVPSSYEVYVDNGKVSKVMVTIGKNKKEQERANSQSFTDIVKSAFKGIMLRNISVYKTMLKDIEYGDCEMFVIGKKILDDERKKYEL